MFGMNGKVTDDQAYFMISNGRNMVLDVMSDTWEDLTGICEGFFPDVIPDDFTDKDRRREFRRDMAKEKDSYPENGTSRFRKGYHKAEKRWKQETRRNRRHNDKAALRNSRDINFDDIKVWAEEQVFADEPGFTREAYGVHVHKDTRGLFIHVLYETWNNYADWDDEDDGLDYGQEVYFLTYDQVKELGI